MQCSDRFGGVQPFEQVNCHCKLEENRVGKVQPIQLVVQYLTQAAIKLLSAIDNNSDTTPANVTNTLNFSVPSVSCRTGNKLTYQGHFLLLDHDEQSHVLQDTPCPVHYTYMIVHDYITIHSIHVVYRNTESNLHKHSRSKPLPTRLKYFCH